MRALHTSVLMIAVAHDPVTLLFLLLAAHALGDFAFQSRFLAMAKNRHSEIGREYWVAALPSHALIHGVLVFAILDQPGWGWRRRPCMASLTGAKTRVGSVFASTRGCTCSARSFGSFSSSTLNSSCIDFCWVTQLSRPVRTRHNFL